MASTPPMETPPPSEPSIPAGPPPDYPSPGPDIDIPDPGAPGIDPAPTQPSM